MSANRSTFLNGDNLKKGLYIAVVSLILYFPAFLHLDTKPLREWDEARNAVNAFEMSKTGNILVKTFRYEPDLWETKPPLLVWLQTLGFKIFGYGELAVRLPSAIAAFLLAWYIIFFFYKYYKRPNMGLAAALVLFSAPGYFEEHAARTGDHDSMLILFTVVMLLNFFQFTMTGSKRNLFVFLLGFTLAVYTKSIAVLMFAPAMLIALVAFGKIKMVLGNTGFWLGIAWSFGVIMLFYIAREYMYPGYLDAVWHNELFPRYFNTSDHYSYHMNDFWYYLRTLKFKQYIYWMNPAIVSIPLNFFILKDKLRKLHTFNVIAILSFFLIISKGSSNFWYDLPLIPLLSISIGMGLYGIFEWLKNKFRIEERYFDPGAVLLILLMVIWPYKEIVERNLDPGDPHAQVSYAYAFRQIEKEMPELKSFYVYDPLGYNYPLVFYSDLFNIEKQYHIENIYNDSLNAGSGYVLMLEEKYGDFLKTHIEHKTILKEDLYRLVKTGK